MQTEASNIAVFPPLTGKCIYTKELKVFSNPSQAEQNLLMFFGSGTAIKFLHHLPACSLSSIMISQLREK